MSSCFYFNIWLKVKCFIKTHPMFIHSSLTLLRVCVNQRQTKARHSLIYRRLHGDKAGCGQWPCAYNKLTRLTHVFNRETIDSVPLCYALPLHKIQKYLSESNNHKKTKKSKTHPLNLVHKHSLHLSVVEKSGNAIASCSCFYKGNSSPDLFPVVCRQKHVPTGLP